MNKFKTNQKILRKTIRNKPAAKIEKIIQISS